MRQKILRYTGILLVTLVLLLWLGGVLFEHFAPQFINIPALKKKIETAILESTGIRANIKTLSLKATLLDGIRVVFDNNVLYDPEDVKVIRAGQITVDVRYLPLLFHKTSISRIAFNHVKVYIGERSFLFRLKRPKVPSKDVVVENARIEFNDYAILVDRYFEGVNKYLFHGDALSLSHVESAQPLELKGWGTAYYGLATPNQWLGRLNLYGRGKQAMLNKPRLDWEDIQHLHVQAEDISLHTIADILKVHRVPLTASGRVGFLYVDVHGRRTPKNLTVQGATTTPIDIDAYGYHFQFDPGQMAFRTQLQLDPKQRVADLTSLFLQLRSQKFESVTVGNMHLSNPLDASRLDLQTKSSWLPLSALQLIPTFTQQQQQLLKVLSGQFKTDLKIIGPLAKPQVSGTITGKKLTVQDSQTQAILAENMQGTLKLDARSPWGKLNLQGRMADSPFVLQGKLNRRTKAITAKWVANNLNLKSLQGLMQTLVPQWSVLSQYQLAGQAGANITLQGFVRHPQITGHMDLSEVSLRQAKPATKLISGLQGTVVFEKNHAQLKNLHGTVGKAPFTLAGGVQYDPWRPNLQITGKQLDLAVLRQLLVQAMVLNNRPVDLLANTQLNGLADVHLNWQGSMQQPKLYGNVRLIRGKALHQASHIHLENMDADMAFAGTALLLKHLHGNLNGVPFRVSGRLENHFKQLALNILALNVNLTTLQPLIDPYLRDSKQPIKMGGTANFNLNLAGTLQKPLVLGTIQLIGASVALPNAHLTLDRLTGAVSLKSDLFALGHINGYANQVPLGIQGNIHRDGKTYRVLVKAHQVPLMQLQSILATVMPQSAQMLSALGLQSGKTNLDLILTSNPTHPVGGTISLHQVTAHPPQLGLPIHIANLSYTLASGKLQLPQKGLTVAGLPFTLSGFATAKDYHVHLTSSKIPMETLRDQHAVFEKLIAANLPTLFNTVGTFQVDALLTPGSRIATLKFWDAGFSTDALKFPLYNLNGAVSLSFSPQLVISSDHLDFRYGNSPMRLNFDIHGLKDLYVEATGTLAPLLVNDILLSNFSRSVAYAAVPFEVILSGQLGELWGKGKGNNLNLFFNVNATSLFSDPSLENPKQPGYRTLDEALLSSVLHLQGDTLKIEQTRFRSGKDSSLLIEGIVRDLFSPQKRSLELALATEPVLDLAALGQQFNQQMVVSLAGTIAANLKILATPFKFHSEGEVRFDHVRSHTIEVEDLHGKIVFNGTKAFLKAEHLQIPGVDVAFEAVVEDLLKYPFPVADFNLVGKQFIVSLYTEWINHVMIGKIRKGFWEQFFPNTGRNSLLAFEIKNGTLNIAEGIINNLIVNNYTSNIRVYPNSYFELNNAQTESAGGRVQGFFAMNPKDNNFMTVHLSIDKMKANAVSRILLNVSNQIFGDLSGTIDFTTEGMTNDEMLAHANGSADLRIEDGRLPAITKAENLLVAANTISGGLANLNLNSLFHLAAPFKTDYFAKLTGTFKMMEGIVYTDNMMSDGSNLDLEIAGLIRLVDSFADLKVRGQMDREIGGVLGPIGDFSIGRFFGFFPPLRKLINAIPGIGFIPGFGGPSSEKGVAFELSVQGPVLDPGSIQNFRWVR